MLIQQSLCADKLGPIKSPDRGDSFPIANNPVSFGRFVLPGEWETCLLPAIVPSRTRATMSLTRSNIASRKDGPFSNERRDVATTWLGGTFVNGVQGVAGSNPAVPIDEEKSPDCIYAVRVFSRDRLQIVVQSREAR
jgi:hypothetical protein